MKLNLGCGSVVLDGWVNVDYAFGARIARIPLFSALNRKLRIFNMDWNRKIHIHNLKKKFPWKDSTVDVVYSSHTLEHFSRQEGRIFLEECYRVLRKGGLLRIVVPDLGCIIREYSEGRLRADELVEHLGVLYGNKSSKFKDKLSPFISFPHKCMYDTPALLSVFHDLQFKAESRKPFDSAIEDIEAIELEGRTQNAVIVEGVK